MELFRGLGQTIQQSLGGKINGSHETGVRLENGTETLRVLNESIDRKSLYTVRDETEQAC